MALSHWEWSIVSHVYICIHNYCRCINFLIIPHAPNKLLEAGLKLEDLRKVYFEMKDKVFKQQSKVLTTACDTDALETLLQKVLGTETTLDKKDEPKQVCACAFKE